MSRQRAFPVFLLMALSVFAVAGLAWLGWRVQSPTPLSSPAAPDAPAIRSLLAADEPMVRSHALLRWTPLAPGTVYEVDVSTTDLKPVAYGAGLAAAEYLIPPDSFTGLTPGTSIAWRVEARLPDGRVVSSPTFVNTVRRR